MRRVILKAPIYRLCKGVKKSDYFKYSKYLNRVLRLTLFQYGFNILNTATKKYYALSSNSSLRLSYPDAFLFISFIKLCIVTLVLKANCCLHKAFMIGRTNKCSSAHRILIALYFNAKLFIFL